MVAGKTQGREDHIFDVLLLAGVVLRRAQHREVGVEEQNKILGVLVALDILLLQRDRLVQLRLQMRARMERREVLRVGVGAVARVELEVGVEVSKVHHALLVFFRLGVGVGIQTEKQLAVGQLEKREVLHGQYDRLRGESVICVERI